MKDANAAQPEDQDARLWVPPKQADGTINPKDAAPAQTWAEALLEAWAAGRTLPLDSAMRKTFPLASGSDNYFPASRAAEAAWSFVSNQKHNPGQPLHWSQHNSSDHEDCIARHSVDANEAQTKVERLIELTAKAWRARAELQMFAQECGAPVAPGARKPGSK